ncbi:S8 family serine peptidase [Flavobacterium piscinae]|uniref:S8 family serine peptidase n=1 Tax=Flavobacterium piscinae TaxID=2506424 RepID=UPI0019C0C425|nr:S8 family serine peptidase [Flavobacterium piscinae]MBC8884298.1 S8 family serine peptidase [Flavobacterium piscinae]
MVGSDYGTNTDVSAPGVKIYTTDISGAAGYSSGDYAPTFNGTSSACPNVAGVMALILSANSNLNMLEARQILESTCSKVGGYTYNTNVSGQPNGTWSNDLGYGRVNALAALQLTTVACTSPPVAGAANASPSFYVSLLLFHFH